jgi:hypothetical protein
MQEAEGVGRTMRTVLIRIGENGDGWRLDLCHDDGREDWLLRPVATEELPGRLDEFAPPPLNDPRTGVEAIRAVLLEQAAVSRDFETIGAHLRSVLGRGEVGEKWDEIVKRESGFGEREGVRVLLDFQPERLRVLPWELMSRGSSKLATDVESPLVRVTPGFRADAKPPLVRWPLRVMVVVGSMEDDKIVEAEQEIAELTDAFRRMLGLVAFEFVCQPSRAQVREKYKQLRPHIFHFIGHGKVERGRGQLELYDGERKENDAWTAGKIEADLKGWQPRLAILNACRSADADLQQGAWGVAEKFTEIGVPAVIAMQADIRGDSAAKFTGALYRALAESAPLDAAVAAGRRAITDLHGDEQRDFALPSLSVSWPPGAVLRLGCGADAQLPPPVESMPKHFTGFVDRTLERGRLSRGLDPDSEDAKYDPGPPAPLIAVVGPADVGKTELARWLVSASELNGGNAVYVDLDNHGRRPFLATLEAIRDALGDSGDHGERNLRAFERWDQLVADNADLDGTRPLQPNAVDMVFSEFNDALREAAGQRPLLIVLDHVGGVQPEHWEFVCKRLLQPIARRQLAPVRAIVVLSKDQHDGWSTKPVEPVKLSMFEPSEWKLIAGTYIRDRFDVEYEDVAARLAEIPAQKRFSWGEVAGLEKLVPVLWGWKERP